MRQVMQWCETSKADMDRLVSKEAAAQIHVVFMGQGLQPEALEQRRLKGDYAKIVAFRPTGELSHHSSLLRLFSGCSVVRMSHDARMQLQIMHC